MKIGRSLGVVEDEENVPSMPYRFFSYEPATIMKDEEVGMEGGELEDLTVFGVVDGAEVSSCLAFPFPFIVFV